MTDPELAERTYVEPLTVEVLEQDHRARAARRAPADARRADRAQPRAGARRGRRAREVRRRADRRDASRRSRRPRTASSSRRRWSKIGLEVPRSGYAHSVEEARDDRRRASASRRSCGPSFTLGGIGRRHRVQRRRVRREGRRGRSRSRRAARSSSRRACSAGRSTSSRSCATARTTSSSSARSRTSIRWACTPATRSPSRRR